MIRDPLTETPVTAKTRPAATDDRIEGMVIALAPNLFEVFADEQMYLCTLRGRLRRSSGASTLQIPPPANARHVSNATRGKGKARTVVQDLVKPVPEPAVIPTRIAPGDRVAITRLPGNGGVIEDVAPRYSVLARTRTEAGKEQVLLANADLAVLVFATHDPAPHFGLLDRYLALCEHARVAPIISLNKVDLGVPQAVSDAADLYERLGYPIIWTSATTNAGLDDLRARLQGKLSLLTGPSGVGKSSLTNALIPGAQQRIGEISQATHKGKHTTTGVRLLPMPDGGWLADSAGIRELSLWNVRPDELARCFVELRPLVGACLYEDCSHSAEEAGCAFQDALARGAISPSRFTSFERLMEEAQSGAPPEWAQR